MKSPVRCGLYATYLSIHIFASVAPAGETGPFLTGNAAMGDWTTDAPGVRRKLTVQDLPPPSSNILSINSPRVVARPADAQLHVPSGFKVEFYAGGLHDPRFLLAAPNGDIFVVEVVTIGSGCCAIPKAMRNLTLSKPSLNMV